MKRINNQLKIIYKKDGYVARKKNTFEKKIGSQPSFVGSTKILLILVFYLTRTDPVSGQLDLRSFMILFLINRFECNCKSYGLKYLII